MQASPGDMPDDSVDFQVVKWNQADGLTIVKNFSETPGHFIGETSSASVPKDDNKGTTMRSIDFSSRQLLLDVAAGGDRSLSAVGLAAGTLRTPAVAVVMRNDGVLMLRDQALDAANSEMKQLKEIYAQILKDAEGGGRKPKQKSGYGSGGSGGMSGMGGAM